MIAGMMLAIAGTPLAAQDPAHPKGFAVGIAPPPGSAQAPRLLHLGLFGSHCIDAPMCGTQTADDVQAAAAEDAKATAMLGVHPICDGARITSWIVRPQGSVPHPFGGAVVRFALA